jgi:hypothetical protein
MTEIDVDLYDSFDEIKQRTHSSGHTLRRDAGLPFPHGTRWAENHRYVGTESNYRKLRRDYLHMPRIKSHGCKLFEHKSNRQWLQRERRHERHSFRNDCRLNKYLFSDVKIDI